MIYLNGHLPVFQHAEDDLAAFRLFTSQHGAVVARRCGRPQELVVCGQRSRRQDDGDSAGASSCLASGEGRTFRLVSGRAFAGWRVFDSEARRTAAAPLGRVAAVIRSHRSSLTLLAAVMLTVETAEAGRPAAEPVRELLPGCMLRCGSIWNWMPLPGTHPFTFLTEPNSGKNPKPLLPSGTGFGRVLTAVWIDRRSQECVTLCNAC